MGGVATAVAGGLASAGGSALLGSVMGDDGGGGGMKRKRDSRYTPAQQEYLRTVLGQATEGIEEGGVEAPPDTVPDPTAGQEAAAEFGEGFLGDDLGLLTEEARGMMEPEEWDPSRSRQRWERTVMDPAMQRFEEDIAPGIMEKYAGRNALSSSGISRALAESTEDIAQRGMSELADLTFRDYTAQRQRNLERQRMGQSLLGQTLNMAGAASTLTEDPRAVEAAQMQEEAKQWEYEQPYNNPWLQRGAQLMGSQPMSTSYIQKPPSASSQFGRAAGGMLGRAGGTALADALSSGGGGGGGSTPSAGGPGTRTYNPPAMGTG